MPNRLAAEQSAYLRSAAHQPVEWFPWGEPAFARARETDRPVLLDIGAVWCHWCHVMDRESYEDPAVAEVLNRDFVCVKVDRDERPDIDTRYQRAIQALTGQGGWPLTAFLTPEGEVFFGGTYFPPESNVYGSPGFLSVLAHVARVYHGDRQKVTAHTTALREHVTAALDEAKAGRVDEATLEEATGRIAAQFDVRYGGFGAAPKFPHPAVVEFLISRWSDTGEAWMREVVEKTLRAMARGGIRDHLGGGFHRYTVDARWIVPHFEKMSYDNSELLRAFCSGYAAFGDPRYQETANGVVDWVLDVLSDREAAVFYSSQDADVGLDDDGDYWTWTVDEARAVLSDPELAVVRRVFDLEPHGEMRHNPSKNVLWWKRDPDPDEWPLLRAGLEKLKVARARRPAPAVDRAAYVEWNAMMAGAFLQAGATLDRPECNTLALRVLERLWSEAWDPGRGMGHVLGHAEPRGLLGDNIQAAAAFLDAFEATGRDAWRDRAIDVMEHCAAAHGDREAGGLFDLAADATGAAYLAHRAKAVQDAPTPSANGVAGLVLARLWALTDLGSWRERLDRHLAACAGGAPDLGLHGATLLRAMDWALHPVTRIEVAGPPGEGPACTMHLLALQTARPRKIVVRAAAARPRATVCVGTTCSLPVDSPEALAALLAGDRGTSAALTDPTQER